MTTTAPPTTGLAGRLSRMPQAQAIGLVYGASLASVGAFYVGLGLLGRGR